MSVEILAEMPSGSQAAPKLNYDQYMVMQSAFQRAVELGHGKEYWPVLLKAIEDAKGKS